MSFACHLPSFFFFLLFHSGKAKGSKASSNAAPTLGARPVRNHNSAAGGAATSTRITTTSRKNELELGGSEVAGATPPTPPYDPFAVDENALLPWNERDLRDFVEIEDFSMMVKNNVCDDLYTMFLATAAVHRKSWQRITKKTRDKITNATSEKLMSAGGVDEADATGSASTSTSPSQDHKEEQNNDTEPSMNTELHLVDASGFPIYFNYHRERVTDDRWEMQSWLKAGEANKLYNADVLQFACHVFRNLHDFEVENAAKMMKSRNINAGAATGEQENSDVDPAATQTRETSQVLTSTLTEDEVQELALLQKKARDHEKFYLNHAIGVVESGKLFLDENVEFSSTSSTTSATTTASLSSSSSISGDSVQLEKSVRQSALTDDENSTTNHGKNLQNSTEISFTSERERSLILTNGKTAEDLVLKHLQRALDCVYLAAEEVLVEGEQLHGQGVGKNPGEKNLAAAAPSCRLPAIQLSRTSLLSLAKNRAANHYLLFWFLYLEEAAWFTFLAVSDHAKVEGGVFPQSEHDRREQVLNIRDNLDIKFNMQFIGFRFEAVRWLMEEILVKDSSGVRRKSLMKEQEYNSSYGQELLDQHHHAGLSQYFSDKEAKCILNGNNAPAFGAAGENKRAYDLADDLFRHEERSVEERPGEKSSSTARTLPESALIVEKNLVHTKNDHLHRRPASESPRAWRRKMQSLDGKMQDTATSAFSTTSTSAEKLLDNNHEEINNRDRDQEHVEDAYSCHHHSLRVAEIGVFSGNTMRYLLSPPSEGRRGEIMGMGSGASKNSSGSRLEEERSSGDATASQRSGSPSASVLLTKQAAEKSFISYYAAVDPWFMPIIPDDLKKDLKNMQTRVEEDCELLMQQQQTSSSVVSAQTAGTVCEVFPLKSLQFSPARIRKGLLSTSSTSGTSSLLPTFNRHNRTTISRRTSVGTETSRSAGDKKGRTSEQVDMPVQRQELLHQPNYKKTLHPTTHHHNLQTNAWQRVFDLVFIDSDHSYGAVRKDIQKYLQMLRPGGLLVGHDLHPDHYITTIGILGELAEFWRQVRLAKQKDFGNNTTTTSANIQRSGEFVENEENISMNSKLQVNLMTDGTWWVRRPPELDEIEKEEGGAQQHKNSKHVFLNYVPQDGMWAKFRDT
ncbi:unnamed protein product [Amoebophrya sp. A120]|nr:unnamed protein product [Amoebophrya sp. A120]|eukprot:GSA120T00015946001.1